MAVNKLLALVAPCVRDLAAPIKCHNVWTRKEDEAQPEHISYIEVFTRIKHILCSSVCCFL